MTKKKITEVSVLALVREHTITASKGAELLGMSVWDFHDLLSANDISLDDETPEEMEDGVQKLQAIMEKKRKPAEAT